MFQAEIEASDFQHDNDYMKARGQPLEPASLVHQLHEWGLVDDPAIPQPTPPEDVDVILPLNTPADRVGIQVVMLGSNPFYSLYSSCQWCFLQQMCCNRFRNLSPPFMLEN